MKNIFLICIITCFIMHFFISCFSKKEITVTGFIFMNETLSISISSKIIMIVGKEKRNIDGFSFFYEKITVPNRNTTDLSIKINIDSGGVKILDTLFLISKANKKPLISFKKPVKENRKREFFILDDSKVIKY